MERPTCTRQLIGWATMYSYRGDDLTVRSQPHYLYNILIPATAGIVPVLQEVVYSMLQYSGMCPMHTIYMLLSYAV